jgi:hypothetical protein
MRLQEHHLPVGGLEIARFTMPSIHITFRLLSYYFLLVSWPMLAVKAGSTLLLAFCTLGAYIHHYGAPSH